MKNTYKWINYFKPIIKKEKEKPIEKDKPKETFWELTVYKSHGSKTVLETTFPDSDDFEGITSFNDFLEWFQCSNNPSYIFRYNEHDLKVFIRDKIHEIQLVKKEI